MSPRLPIPTQVTGATLVPAADLRRVLDQLTRSADEARRGEGMGDLIDPPSQEENEAYADALDLAINLVTVTIHRAANRAGDLARDAQVGTEDLAARARDFAGNPSVGADASAALVLRIQHDVTVLGGVS